MSFQDPSERRALFVAAAKVEFFANGFSDTTMSAIAARVGGSKTTLWSNFPSKQALFAAVVDDLVAKFGVDSDAFIEVDLPLADALRGFARTMMNIAGEQEVVNLHRMVIGEAGRLPELGRVFFEHGPGRGGAMLSGYLGSAMTDGRVRLGSPTVAASHFVALCQSGAYQERLWGLVASNDPESVAEDIEQALRAWMCSWRSGQ